MANQTVAVTLTARDNASPAFKQVGNSATAAGKQIDAAGTSVGRFDTVMSRLSKTGMAFGAALGALSGIMADSARKSAEAEISNERLRTSIEATGATFEEFEQQLKAAGDAAVQMGFDDEDAADSISRLTQSTGDVTTAITDLGLAMDIARGRGISLAEATKIIEYVETGRMESLRRLGIVIDENASKEEALAELQRRYAGQAQTYSETTAGTLDQLRQRLENVQESLGEHAGALQTVLVLMPGVSAAWVAATTALGGLTKMLGTSAQSATGLLGMLTKIGGFRMGVGIGLGAVLLDMFVGVEDAGEGADNIWEAFIPKVRDLQTSINQMTAAGGDDMRAFGDEASAAFGLIGDAAKGYLGEFFDETMSLDVAGILGNGADAALRLEDALKSFDAIMSHPGPGAAQAQAQLESLFETFNDAPTAMGADVLFEDIIAIADSLDTLDAAAQETKGALDPMVASLVAGTAAGAAMNEQMAELTEAMRGALVQQFNAVTAAYTQTTAALDNGFRVIVGNTNAIAQQSDAVFQWAEELIAAEGTYSKLDDLLASGAINQREYARAQEAYNSIAQDNAAIQEDILSIQAKQAPVIAQLMADQAAYWDEIADAPADQQRLALAYQDTATSAQALAIAQAAASGAPGLEGLIRGAIAANPLLEEILEDMGIISLGTNGKLTIHTEGQSELDNLTETIDTLTRTLWIARFGGDIAEAEAAFNEAFGLSEDWDNSNPQATIAADNSDAQEGFDSANTWFSSWDGSAATASANVIDNASGTMSDIIAMLYNIDGYQASAQVTTYYTNVGQPGFAEMHGGTTPLSRALVATRAAAHGLTSTLVGERGPEMVMLPGGAQVMSTEGTRSRTGGSGGDVHIHIENLYGDETLAERVSTEIVPAVVRAMALHERGF